MTWLLDGMTTTACFILGGIAASLPWMALVSWILD